jgi:hypothetical protein
MRRSTVDRMTLGIDVACRAAHQARIIACWRAGTHYQLRDTDGTPITPAQGRQIIHQRYRVSDDLRAQRRTSHTKTTRRAGDERSRQALRHQPAPTHATTRQPA